MTYFRQELCTRSDANLVDVAGADEQTFLQGFVEEAQNSLWIGYKTMVGIPEQYTK